MKSSIQRQKCRVLAIGAGILALLPAGVCVAGDEPLEYARSRAKDMLSTVAKEIQKNYYDPSLRGLDWEGLTRQARQRIEAAHSNSEMFVAIFSLVDKLQDSHTFFIPPPRVRKVIFGFEAKAFGDEIRIYRLKKGGAGEKAGLQLGDRLVSVEGYRVERSSFDQMMLYFRILHPRPELSLVIVRGSEPPLTVAVKAELKEDSAVMDLTKLDTIYRLIREEQSQEKPAEFESYNGGIGYIKWRSFPANPELLEYTLKKSKSSRALIVDLRGNHGGALETLTTMAEMVGRKDSKPIKIKPRRPYYEGPVFILVDSQSASAAEMFARHFQRTKRAVIVGDKTSGRVTTAKIFPEKLGVDIVAMYAVEIGVARVVYSGGEEIEKRGVQPDHVCLPTETDLREQRDVCRARAIALARAALKLPEQTQEQQKQNDVE